MIRSLMEKATIYRAISAPTALVGGLASIFAGLGQWAAWPLVSADFQNGFLPIWLGVLMITLVANTYFIWRDSVRRKEPFISAGMKMALASVFPPLLTGGFFTVIFSDYPRALVHVWMIFYGLALIATRHISPSSIPRLGWAFLVSGLLSFSSMYFCVGRDSFYEFWMMLLTFGLFHLIYAACTWPRKASPTS